ncbi:MAG: hypothetical protein QY322_03220 [bacterium]|nr:MAG: hypothetical protein QY322_03220 [bacterium]
MPLKLTSNLGRPNLEGVGYVSLDQNSSKITIVCEPGCTAFLDRGGNEVKLAEGKDKTVKVSGIAKIGDIYSITRGLEKLIVKVEQQIETVEEDIYINTHQVNDSTDQKRKTVISVGIIVLILLIVSVVFGINQKKINEFNKKSTVLLNQALSDYDLAVSGSVDVEDARKSFVNSKTIALELKSSGFKNNTLDELIEKINSIEANILGEIQAEIKEFLDLTLQTSGFMGYEVVSSGEEMFILDKDTKNIIRVEIKNKNARLVVNSSEGEGIEKIGSYENRLFLEKNDGIYELKSSGMEKQVEKDWENSIFYLYAGNIYTLGINDNQIYRYSGSQGGFSSKSSWLAPGIEMDLSKVTDVAIDGSIWAISSSGKVTKFTLGNPQSISLKGISEQLINPTAIYTNENLKYVYILEKDRGRVVVLEKNGNFKMQYINDEIKNTTDLVVSEKENKIILLTGPKLLFIEPNN